MVQSKPVAGDPVHAIGVTACLQAEAVVLDVVASSASRSVAFVGKVGRQGSNTEHGADGCLRDALSKRAVGRPAAARGARARAYSTVSLRRLFQHYRPIADKAEKLFSSGDE